MNLYKLAWVVEAGGCRMIRSQKLVVYRTLVLAEDNQGAWEASSMYQMVMKMVRADLGCTAAEDHRLSCKFLGDWEGLCDLANESEWVDTRYYTGVVAFHHRLAQGILVLAGAEFVSHVGVHAMAQPVVAFQSLEDWVEHFCSDRFRMRADGAQCPHPEFLGALRVRLRWL